MLRDKELPENPNFSICTVLYKSGDVLDAMLDSIILHLTADDELILFDNYPESKDHILVEKFGERTAASILYIPSVENIGFARACNQMAAQASKGRLIFLNPDTTTEKFDRLAHLPNLVIGPLIFHMNGLRQSSSGRSRTIKDEFRMRWLRKFEINDSRDEIAYVSGAALSIDREAFHAVGGFDENFFMYFEDIDLCLRAREIGMRIQISDTWKIRHVGGSAARKIRTESEIRSLQSALIFYRKWHQNVHLYKFLIMIDSLARCLMYLAKREVPNAKSQKIIILRLFRRID